MTIVMRMNDDEHARQSLQTWLDQVYLQWLKSLEDAICEDHGEAGLHPGHALDFMPILPIQLDGCFVNTVYRQHALEMTGAFYTVLELVVDFAIGHVIAANVLVPEQTKSLHVINVARDVIQTSTIEGILQGIEPARAMNAETLDALFAAVKLAIGTSAIATEAIIPQIDTIRVIDAKVFEQIIGLGQEQPVPGAQKTSLRALLRGVMAWLSFYHEGLIRGFPVEDKLSSFLGKVGATIQDLNADDVVQFMAPFIPRGSLAIVLYTSDAITAMRAEKDGSGQIILSPLEIPASFMTILPGAGNFNAMGRALKKTARVNVVLFFNIDGLADAFMNFMDSVMAKEHDANGPGLVQVTAESLLLYLRTFEQTWFSVPKPMLFKLVARFLLRFNRLHLDLPRMLHDKVASEATRVIQDNFGLDFTAIACLVSKEKEKASFHAISIEVKGLVPRAIKPVDPAVLEGIDTTTMDAITIAKAIHGKALATISSSPIYVIVMMPRFTSAIATAARGMFTRVALNPFSLSNVVKVFKNEKNFGLHPVPSGISAILAKKPVLILREISAMCFLKY